MPIETVLTKRLGLAHPIIQAPLAGESLPLHEAADVERHGALLLIGGIF